MEMVWQNADGVGFERQARLNRTINLPQALDMLDKQFAGPVKKREREEEYPAFDCWTPISRHQRIMARVQGSQNGGRCLLPRGLGKSPTTPRRDSAHMADRATDRVRKIALSSCLSLASRRAILHTLRRSRSTDDRLLPLASFAAVHKISTRWEVLRT